MGLLRVCVGRGSWSSVREKQRHNGKCEDGRYATKWVKVEGEEWQPPGIKCDGFGGVFQQEQRVGVEINLLLFGWSLVRL